MAHRRLSKELQELELAFFHHVKVDEGNLLKWEGVLTPNEAPYKNGAFRIAIEFPSEYPFKPPKIKFLTKIYHPNVSQDGDICLPIIEGTNWKPATKIGVVLEHLLALLNCPEPSHPLRPDLAQQFLKDRALFNKTAESYTQKHAEKLK